MLRSGEHKLWLVVEPAYEKELERRMRQGFPKLANCSQAVRHLSRVICPSKLDEWKIPYSLDCCKPGEAIVTEPGAFHSVLNMGANYAIAITFCTARHQSFPRVTYFVRKAATRMQSRQLTYNFVRRGFHWPRFKQTRGRVCREIKSWPCSRRLSRRKGRQFRQSLSRGRP